MTEDRHDAQIRDLVAELASSAPPAPPFRRIADRLATGNRAGVTAPNRIDVVALDSTEQAPDPEPLYVKDRDNGVRRHTKPWRALAALVALGLATAGGAFAYGSLTADDGTGSPEQAVKQFVHAFGNSDVAGMLESLPPSERVVLRESLESLNSQGRRLQLTKDLDLNSVAGVHLEVSNLQVSSRPMADGVAAVDVQGTVRSTANDRELPLGRAARDVLVDSVPDDGYQGWADSIDSAINDNSTNGRSIQLVTIKEGGGWHVSVWYTLAEYARKHAGLPMPDFGHSQVKPLGAASPEAVVRALFETSGHYDKALALATPEESRVLYDYVPVLTKKQTGNAFAGVATKVLELGLRTDGSGDRRTVYVDRFEIEASSTDTAIYDSPSGSGTPESRRYTYRSKFDGSCFTTTSSDRRGVALKPFCRRDALASGMSPVEWNMETTRQLTVERHDGRWFISPVRSLVGESVARLAMLPDGKAFTALAKRGSYPGAAAVLPLDLLVTAIGDPFGGSSLSVRSSSAATSESGSAPTTLPARRRSTSTSVVPTTSLTVPATVAPPTSGQATAQSPTTAPVPRPSSTNAPIPPLTGP